MDSGVEGIEAQCGGAGICTTCHCYFDERVFARLPMANEDEREMLSYISNRKKTSRLTCQIPVVTEYDGFVIYVAPRELR